MHVDVRESTDRVVTVTLRGVLVLESVPAVRRVLRKHLSDRPAAIIVDITDLVLGSSAAATVFHAAANHQPSPGVPLIVVTGQQPRRPPLGTVRATALIVCPTLADANDLARRRSTSNWRLLRLPPVPASAAGARQLVRQACRDWGVSHVADLAVAVVSELVGNAVVHAGTPIELSVSNRDAHLYLGVRDDSPVAPRRLPGARDEPGADDWGLYLVDVFAVAWGVVPLPTGKRVWASLRTRPIGPGETP